MQTTTTYDKNLLANLLAQRRYGEALQYIDSLHVKKNRDFAREDLAHLYFAQGQCLYRLGKYGKAAVKVRCSIWLSDFLNDNLLYARQKGTLGQVYFEMGRINESLEEFTEASAFFRRVKDTPRSLAAQEMIALIQFHKGNYDQACELNEAILPQVKSRGLIEHVKVVSFNLCRILLWTGGLSRIRELLDSVSNDCTDPLNQTWLESLWGTYYVRVLDYDLAKKHLEKALSIACANGYRRDEVVCMEYLGLNEFYAGNYAEARNYYQQILAMEETTASAMAQTLRLLTDVQVALGELDAATETAVKAEAGIIKIKEWVELGCLHRALAQLADKRGDRDGASDHFGKSVEVLTRHGARYELAVTYLAAGEAGCLDADIRKERLLRAKTLFADMKVPKRVSQTLLAMAKLEPRPLRIHNHSVTDPEIVTQAGEMTQILDHAARFAAGNMTILLTGETGTGKDLLAKRIHCLSARSGRPFYNHNMARLPRDLADAELFGYEKNSHSRAERNKAGLIELANGGTLCLNEISELPLEMQSKLLLSLEENTVWRVGARCPTPVDVRFIAITNSDLREQVRTGRFREDLFHRLEGCHLHLPPLRERPGDLPLLLQFFLKRLKFGEYDLKQTAMIVEKCGLNCYHWPGNVRELENVIGRSVVLAPLPNLPGLISALSDDMRHQFGRRDSNSERDKLLAALRKCDGNKTKAATQLGLRPSTFRDRLKKHGLE